MIKTAQRSPRVVRWAALLRLIISTSLILAAISAGLVVGRWNQEQRLVTQHIRPIVLLVDDNPDVRLSFRFLLETDEFQVIEASSAASALDRLRDIRVDVVLTDLFMPGSLDGVDLVQAIRLMPKPHPAIIAMSGEPDAHGATLRAAQNVGADATLTKPFTRADLLEVIRKVLGGEPILRVERPSGPSFHQITRPPD